MILSSDNYSSFIRNRRMFSACSLIVVIAVTLMTVTTISLANAQTSNQTTYVAGLVGNEKTSLKTNASGSATFIPTVSGNIAYILNVTNVVNVTEADIHLGKQGQNGTAIVTLFRSGPSSSQNHTLFAKGNISSSNLQGPLKGEQLDQLVRLMNNGDSYVNVRTQQNPNGEVFGQIGFEGIDESGTMLGESKEIPAPPEME
jgi:hypothetical protein